MRGIPDRDRWLALAILAGVLAVAYLVLVHPWWTAPMLEVGDRMTLSGRNGAGSTSGARARMSSRR